MASRPINSASVEGTFEYIEAKIRRDAVGTAFGGDFERLCKWFLENAPRYRGQFEKVWLWYDYPDRWSREKGIDIVAQTRTGELWAIQCKAYDPDYSIPKKEINSFLSESNRREIAYRLLIATTDRIGENARETLSNQEKSVGLVLRGNLLTEQVQWPLEIGGTAEPLARWNPKDHQHAAIKAVVDGFRRSDRGRLIMACGTGKTLTALWIAERLNSSRTLILVPSLALVLQNVEEWGRHATQEFDPLIVCSNLHKRGADEAIQSTVDLGIQPTRDDKEIRATLDQQREHPLVVFATYQSSGRIAAAQSGETKPFDLVICDEAHRLAGNVEGLFATVLNGERIKARKRLFMTATPRYITQRAKSRAAELEVELVSMDDEQVFGPKFHVLTFREAINAEPEPLLTDYQVVVIGVTDREARALAEEAELVRTTDGHRTDARTLASQIGLAKAMKKYDLRKMITFHSSVAKAKRFADPTMPDSLPSVIARLKRSAKPSGKIWSKHISGHTPAGTRASLLEALGKLTDRTRGLISNCACLGEGVDVPVLDGVAFIDPKRSMIDIIQAVGRVIRKAENKQIGTIVIPVLIDETEDPDHALSQSAFEPVWQVLKALRAHDKPLADELDELRTSLGRHSKRSGRIRLPDKIRLDVPRLLLRDFEQAFYVRTVELTTTKPDLTVEQILEWADAYLEKDGRWPSKDSGEIPDTEETWGGVNAALLNGNRGLPHKGSSLAKLLRKHRAKRHHKKLPDLSIEQILEWADAYFDEYGEWPDPFSSLIRDTGETWAGIQHSLNRGGRNLPGGSSLAQLLDEHREVRNKQDLPEYRIEQILNWVDEYMEATGKWPDRNSGLIGDTGETWGRVDDALLQGNRGMTGGSSLTKLLSEHRGKRNVKDLPDLAIEQILVWADSYFEVQSDWPKQDSGEIPGTEENWSKIDHALRNDKRGLRGGSSLPNLLAKHRGVKNVRKPANLSVEQVLAWADAYFKEHREWPMKRSGDIDGTDETWSRIDDAFCREKRGLPKSTLTKFLSEHRRKNIRPNVPRNLTIEEIVWWAKAYKKNKGKRPTKRSGPIDGTTDETWSKIENALRLGKRGLPRTTLAKFLDEHLR